MAPEGLLRDLSPVSEMSPRIQIVGAGIAGLSLACHLRVKNIPFKLFDRGPELKRHNYGITLRPQYYGGLLEALNITQNKFQEVTSVDRFIEGKGRHSSTFKASDSELRKFLCRHQTIAWNHKVVSCTLTSNGLELLFEDGRTSTAPITIDASGLNSPIILTLQSDLKPSILPYSVYHGTRYIPITEYEDGILNKDNDYEFQVEYKSNIYHFHLSRAIIQHERVPSSLRSKFGTGDLVVEFRYTMSRPAMSEDPIFNPSRSKEEAKDIPPEFWEELGGLLESNSIPPGIKSFLAPSIIKSNNDRVLNWLMRRQLPSLHQLEDLAKQGVFLIGDSAHGLPILGSDGANIAMEDARILADHIGSMTNSDSTDFYQSRSKAWEEAIEVGTSRLRQMHQENHGKL